VKAVITSQGDVTIKFIPEVFLPSYMLVDNVESTVSTPST